MKTRLPIFSVLVLSLLLTGCGGIFNFVRNGRTVRASDTVVSETRPATGFTAVDMRAVGRVVLSQGETESLVLRGSDNVVPLVTTAVRDGVLVIEMPENVSVNDMNAANVLTLAIGVKELSALTASGLGDVQMDGLSASALTLTVIGAGRISLQQLQLERLSLALNGAGDVTLSGKAVSASILISGAGNVNAADLETQTAGIDIQGLGNAKVWVTGKLTGSISGAGNVEYYGNPQTDTHVDGFGVYQSLGDR
jgi:hypothetical protein